MCTILVGTEYSIRPSLSIGAEIRHQSSMRTGRDYGENTAGLFLRFTPGFVSLLINKQLIAMPSAT